MERYYGRSRGFVDGDREFHGLVVAALGGGSRILEIGAGPSNPSSEFFASLGELTGLDLDPEVRSNRSLAHAEVFDGTRFPFADETFDLCASNYVLEHVPDPATHFAEVRRVLKPGGAYVFRTPNRFHYVTAVAAMTPHWFHELVANRLRNLPADAHDPYPTVYAANSSGAIARLAARAGLIIEGLHHVEKEPSYGMASPLLFYPFMAYERLVNSSEAWRFLRANIFGVLRRPSP